MTTTATHNAYGTTPERVLFMAFALRETTWKLGFTTGPGQKPRARAVAARDQERLRQESAQAHFCKHKESSTMWWIPPRLQSIDASVGPKANAMTMAVCGLAVSGRRLRACAPHQRHWWDTQTASV
jgi:hypothetical protein